MDGRFSDIPLALCRLLPVALGVFHDTRSHNPVLYQLSYAHHIVNRAGRSGFNRSGRTSRA